MLRILALLALLTLPFALPPATSRAADFPQPSVEPQSWELEFTSQTPRRIVVNIPGARTPTAYWYIPYSIVNLGTDPIDFLPEFELVMEDGKVYRGDVQIPREVFDAIKKREKNDLLEPPDDVRGEILPGEDQTHETVVIWREPQREMGTFSIYIAGLSGEYVVLDASGNVVKLTLEEAMKQSEKADQYITLHKTLQLTYHVNGDDIFPGDDEIRTGTGRGGINARRWIMR